MRLTMAHGATRCPRSRAQDYRRRKRTLLTPLICLVRSVTVDTTRREMRSPSSMAEPSNTEWAPGTRGNHLLSTVVEWSKLVGSKSLAPIVLRCSDWFRSEFFSVPDSELVAAQAEAQNTKSNAIDAKWVRRSLIFSLPFRPPALVARTSLRLRDARHH